MNKARKPSQWIARSALFLYCGIAIAPLIMLVLKASQESGASALFDQLLSKANLSIIRFTFVQAFFSALVSIAIGLPGAFFIARYRFFGRRLLKSMGALPLWLPAILVVTAFIQFYGVSGFFNTILKFIFPKAWAGSDLLYSMWGIILVQGFYEFPLIVAIVGSALENISRDREDAARVLGAGPVKAFWHGTMPSLIPALCQSFGLAFLLCYFSFVIVMVFGSLSGTTIELAIFQRIRFDSNWSGASQLALLGTAFAFMFLALVSFAEKRGGHSKTINAPCLAKPRGFIRVSIVIYGAFLVIFFGGPLAALLVQAFSIKAGDGAVHFSFQNFAALLNPAQHQFILSLFATIITALPAALLAVLVSIVLVFVTRNLTKAEQTLHIIPLSISTAVTSLGWSTVFSGNNVALISLMLAFASIPYALRTISSALQVIQPQQIDIARVMGARRISVFWAIELPAIKPALLSAFGLGFAASAGDTNVPLILAQGSFEPLPLLLFRLVAARRFGEACACGILLGLLCSAFLFACAGRTRHA